MIFPTKVFQFFFDFTHFSVWGRKVSILVEWVGSVSFPLALGWRLVVLCNNKEGEIATFVVFGEPFYFNFSIIVCILGYCLYFWASEPSVS